MYILYFERNMLQIDRTSFCQSLKLIGGKYIKYKTLNQYAVCSTKNTESQSEVYQ